MSTASSANHPWKFRRIGGLDQVSLDTGADLLALEKLDQKLWVALSCPVKGLQLCEKTLGLIDQDNDGRIRAPELITAIKWADARFKDVGSLISGSDELKLSSLDESKPAGRAALASVRTILASLEKPNADSLTLTEATDTVKFFAATTLNGDGIVIPDSTSDEQLKQLITDVITATGGAADLSGKLGANAANVATFFNAAQSFVNWTALGATAEVKPYGENTTAAAAAIAAVRAKIDDYFTRIRLAAFDARAAAALNHAESEFVSLAVKDLTLSTPEIAALPLAAIGAVATLPLIEGTNPAWAGALAKLHATAVTAAFGADKKSLTEAEWNQLKAAVAAHDVWQDDKTGAMVEALGVDRLKALIADTELRAALDALIAKDLALAPEFNAISEIEQLIRYQRDFKTLLNNFVNFTEFYSPNQAATFQAGTLFLDSRSTNLCIEVAGPSPLAAMSKVYIAYCDCSRPGGAKMKIAACFTQGDSDYLFVGRNGIFYDRKGQDWDAKITAVAENPISIKQAFWLPYKKFLRAIEEMVAKRAAAAEAASDKRMAETATKTTNADTAKPAASTDPKKVDIGTVAAIGVAATAAISALTLILGHVFGMAAWQYPLVLVGIVMVISGPSMLIAWLKLRQRTLGPILEANGWAINGRVKINVPFGTRLTTMAKIPAGATRSLDDPYVDKDAARRKRLFWLGVIVVIAVGIRLHATHFNEGRYFWQSAPEPVIVAPTEVPPPPAA